jgi:hypothetical protein
MFRTLTPVAGGQRSEVGNQMADEEKAETQHEFDSTMYGIHAIGHLSSVIRRPSSVIRRLSFCRL